jgi:hypothetical protein
MLVQIDITDVMEAERRVQLLQEQQLSLLKEILPAQVSMHHESPRIRTHVLQTVPTYRVLFSGLGLPFVAQSSYFPRR